MLRALIIAAYLLLPAAASSFAQEHERTEKLGVVHFSTSCNNDAQREFDRATTLLHSFQFGRAIQGFNTALKDDPTCGIAYWGIALSQWSNPFAAGMKDASQLQAGRTAVEFGKKAGAKTEREREYIAAVGSLYEDFDRTAQRTRLLGYRDAMAEVAAKYPTDDEAKIFYALAIAASEDPANKTYAGRLQAGEILENLFKQEPNHPGLAHYIIHTYDVPSLAPRALDAARRYSEIAPDAPHALHMPSHTFTRTGYWEDSINSNVAAEAAAKREGQTAEELHASDYLTYAYLQMAQDHAAHSVLNSLQEIALRFDPKVVIGGAAGPSTGYFALAAIPTRYALERGDWRQAAQLVPRDTPFPYTTAMTWFARGYGSARLAQVAPAYQAVAALKQIREQLLESRETYWALQVQIQEQAVRAWALMAEEKKEEALLQMESAAVLEDGTEKSAVTPGPLAPARELFAEMLLAANQPAAALVQFEETLKKEPGRFRALYGAGHAAQLSGNAQASKYYFRQLLKVCEHADKPGRVESREAEKAISLK